MRVRTYLIKTYLIAVLACLVLGIASFLLTFGYEEGTMHIRWLGELSSSLFLLLTSPLRFIPVNNSYSLLLWSTNIVLWAFLATVIIRYVKMQKHRD